ncbi:MAG: MFS transporter [Acidobacteriia bacterium]|nr:MFS transporter [Terriglobia bacterium]
MAQSLTPNSSESPPVDPALSRNIRAFGWAAFFNDTATEMSYWLLPRFLVGVLGAGPMAFGLIEGAAESVASFGRLASGFLADRWRRRKPLAAAGYTVANLAKPLLALSQTWGQVFWIRFFDRAAKGFRAAPRDALIADSVPASQRGAAFGFRQAMDSAGAMAGPLAALLLLPLFLGDVRKVFWAATVPGLASLAVAWLAVREVRPKSSATQRSSEGGFAGLSAVDRRLWLILAAVTVFSLGNSSDLFLILRAQNLGLGPGFAPALGFVFNVVYTLLSWPAGKLSDRIPRRILIILGYSVYAAVYLGFAMARSVRLVWLLMPAYGLYYGLTEGVMKAWISDLVPSERRASVYGVFNWVVGLTLFPASLAAGWMWQRYSPATPFYFSAALASTAAVLLALAGSSRARA